MTLIGDAAHFTTSFAGSSTNLAMLDGLELGIVLVEATNGGEACAEHEAAITA